MLLFKKTYFVMNSMVLNDMCWYLTIHDKGHVKRFKVIPENLIKVMRNKEKRYVKIGINHNYVLKCASVSLGIHS